MNKHITLIGSDFITTLTIPHASCIPPATSTFTSTSPKSSPGGINCTVSAPASAPMGAAWVTVLSGASFTTVSMVHAGAGTDLRLASFHPDERVHVVYRGGGVCDEEEVAHAVGHGTNDDKLEWGGATRCKRVGRGAGYTIRKGDCCEGLHEKKGEDNFVCLDCE
ncbi:hypothetical protein BC830DRAFT_1175182 [Chytriomyces sp. MP71]|nr:hypothetical protein BC830DRAFT_1175182 [Chytriomyces sp. MP71]